MIYSKTLDIEDYSLMTEHTHVLNVDNLLSRVDKRFEHQHRIWEYGIVLNALRKKGVKSVIDVGGGGSIFAPSAVWLGMEVIQVDPGECSTWVTDQANKLKLPLTYIQKDFFDFENRIKFDAVVCLSVIEHVPDHVKFFQKLQSFVKPKGLLALTTDFHPSGKQRTEGHIRTYNEAGLITYKDIAKGFNWFDGGFNYTYRGEDVNNYTFASLILERE